MGFGWSEVIISAPTAPQEQLPEKVWLPRGHHANVAVSMNWWQFLVGVLAIRAYLGAILWTLTFRNSDTTLQKHANTFGICECWARA